MRPLAKQTTGALDIQPGRGVLIISTYSWGPAEADRLRPDDVVVGINGRQISNLADFRALLTITRRGNFCSPS